MLYIKVLHLSLCASILYCLHLNKMNTVISDSVVMSVIYRLLQVLGGRLNKKSDMWSLGACVYQLITSKEPWDYLEAQQSSHESIRKAVSRSIALTITTCKYLC